MANEEGSAIVIDVEKGWTGDSMLRMGMVNQSAEIKINPFASHSRIAVESRSITAWGTSPICMTTPPGAFGSPLERESAAICEANARHGAV